MKDLRAELLTTEERVIDQSGRPWSTTRSLSLRLMDRSGDTTDSCPFDDLPGDIGPGALVVARDGGSLLVHLRCPFGEYVGVRWVVFAIRQKITWISRLLRARLGGRVQGVPEVRGGVLRAKTRSRSDAALAE